MGYRNEELESVPKASVIGAGCGSPVRFADLQPGEMVVDLGSGSGIDVFLAAKKVGKSGRVIGIDMTDEMLDKARKASKETGSTNIEFKKGDIEKTIAIEDNLIDVAISNCVITLTVDKSNSFKEILSFKE
jgi:arsenite methyltransferase